MADSAKPRPEKRTLVAGTVALGVAAAVAAVVVVAAAAAKRKKTANYIPLSSGIDEGDASVAIRSGYLGARSASGPLVSGASIVGESVPTGVLVAWKAISFRTAEWAGDRLAFQLVGTKTYLTRRTDGTVALAAARFGIADSQLWLMTDVPEGTLLQVPGEDLWLSASANGAITADATSVGPDELFAILALPPAVQASP